MVTTKDLLIERRVTVILDRTLFSVASSVLSSDTSMLLVHFYLAQA